MRRQALHGPAGLTAPASARGGGADDGSAHSETGGNEKRQRGAAETAGTNGQDLLLSMSTMVSESVSESVGARMEEIMAVGGCENALYDWFDNLLRSDGSECQDEC